MSNAVIFDWDGTLVSCEEKIDLAIERLCQTYPEITEEYLSTVSVYGQSQGWIRKGFIVSLPEDYFTYHFGIIAGLIAEATALTTDAAWLIILRTFKESYLQGRARMLADQKKFRCLSKFATFYVVSNSDIDNISTEADVLGFERSIMSFIGGAKKYGVERSIPSILGISAARPKYKEILNMIREKHENLIVVGDNFSLDLVTSITMGIRTAYVPNPLSPNEIVRYVKDNQILSGDINYILNSLTQEMKGNMS